MTSVCLQMISIGSLLIFNDRTSLSVAGRSTCISEDQMKNRADKFQRSYRDPLNVSKSPDTRTCEQAAREMQGEHNQRSLSPWRYSRNRDENRVPHEIAVAECLCLGCIIDHREDMNYNSVEVLAPLMVLRKSPCQPDSKTYVVKKEVIQVPVACTCVVPNYTKNQLIK